MESMELDNLLQQYQQALNQAQLLNMQSWQLNLKCFENQQGQKARSSLKPVIGIKVLALVLGILWVGFLGILVFAVGWKNPYFSISLSMIILFTLLAMAAYTWHLSILLSIKYEDNVLDTQAKISKLKLSTIQMLRIILLQIPFHCTWFWSPDWVNSHDIKFWLISFPIFIAFTALTIWLFLQIKPQNVNKPWLKKFLSLGIEYKNLEQAESMLAEIKEFKMDFV
ncbi:MAG: hypothetical protein CFE25_16940 [Chitinophagaceae bacterium BSSC1]|nr:MAG: hypothetical protein CFE25_16940 [Chitinophagaceae bacterium BSSC1]